MKALLFCLLATTLSFAARANDPGGSHRRIPGSTPSPGQTLPVAVPTGPSSLEVPTARYGVPASIQQRIPFAAMAGTPYDREIPLGTLTSSTASPPATGYRGILGGTIDGRIDDVVEAVSLSRVEVDRANAVRSIPPTARGWSFTVVSEPSSVAMTFAGGLVLAGVGTWRRRRGLTR